MSVILRTATPQEARPIHHLITAHLAEGHLLPRTMDEVRLRASGFVVATERGRIVACAELAPLSRATAEVRSLIVDSSSRGQGLGRQIVGELRQRGRNAGFERLCAFTHDPAFFVRIGFSIVPHVWIAEKMITDCYDCALFRRCGQVAMTIPLAVAGERPQFTSACA